MKRFRPIIKSEIKLLSMDCGKFKESIYLYEELTVERKRTLEAHLHQCASCTELLNKLQFVSARIKSASALPNAPRNSALLTRKIMDAVENQVEKQNQWLMPLERLLNLTSLRYALAIISVVIVLEFISEQTNPEMTDFQTQQPVASLQTVLSTSTFLKTIETTRQWNDTEKRTSILRYLKTKKTYEQHE